MEKDKKKNFRAQENQDFCQMVRDQYTAVENVFYSLFIFVIQPLVWGKGGITCIDLNYK